MLIKIYNKGTLLYELPLAATNAIYEIGKEQGQGKTYLMLPEEAVSRKHATLTIQDGSVYIKDNNSTNGTYINNQKLQPQNPLALKVGDVVHFAVPHMQAVVFGNNEPVEKSIGKSLSDLLKDKDAIVIGRNSDSDIVLRSEHVSRAHCQVYRKNNRYFVKDLNSRNGTFINGKRISGDTEIKRNDVILVGTSKFSLGEVASDIRTETALQISGLEKKFGEKYGFHLLNINIPAQSITGIMGPSGCGKSTILNTLTGNILPSSGNIFIHGLSLFQNYQYLKYYIGYVPQYDIVHKDLTVYESMYYTARIRLELSHVSFIGKKIDTILESLNIADIKHQSIHSLSGGQKKRVCIATELINDPLVLFLDEPTSPLDPQSGMELMNILKVLSANGTTIVIVTHKPDDLKYLDKVLFLGKGGIPMFYGKPAEHLQHFKEGETTDVYQLLNSPENKRFTDISQKFTEQNKTTVSLENSSGSEQITQKSFNYAKQLYWLVARCIRIKLNDRVNSSLLLLQAPVIALLIATIFNNINLSVLFLLSVSAIWLGTNNAGREIVGEADIYKRERMFNLGITPYIFSKLAVFAFLGLIQSVLFTAIIAIRYSDGYPPVENAMMLCGWFFTLNIVSATMGLVISTYSKNNEQVVSIIPLVLIPQILLAGTIERVNNFFVELISYCTLSRWGTEGFANLQSKIAVPDNNNVILPSKAVLLTRYDQKYYSNDIFGSITGTFSLDSISITIIFMIFFLALFLGLKRRDTI